MTCRLKNESQILHLAMEVAANSDALGESGGCPLNVRKCLKNVYCLLQHFCHQFRVQKLSNKISYVNVFEFKELYA